MSTIKLVLDNRKKLKDNKYNLSIRVCHKGNVQYLPVPDAMSTLNIPFYIIGKTVSLDHFSPDGIDHL